LFSIVAENIDEISDADRRKVISAVEEHQRWLSRVLEPIRTGASNLRRISHAR
jgi:hypothetical protein